MFQKLFLYDLIRSFIRKLLQRPDFYAIKYYTKQRKRAGYSKY